MVEIDHVIKDRAGWQVWLAVTVLALGTFSIVTTELAPIGLLTSMATDFATSKSTVGLIVTIYAWIGAVAALISMLTLGHVPRKPLLVGLMLVLAISSTLTLIAPTFSGVLGSRVIGAIAHGSFWAIIGTLAAQIAPARHVGRATAIIFGGVSAASVLGVPLANVVGQMAGWRTAFGGIALLALFTSLMITAFVPRVPASAPVGRTALMAVIRRGDLWWIYGATAFSITAHFAAFTYIEPFINNTPAIPTTLTAALLFGFGAAGLLGNFATGVFIDRYLKSVLILALGLMSACLSALGLIGISAGTTVIVLLLIGWGMSIAAVFVGFQTWILRVAGDAALPASAIYVAIFNAAIGTGALIGSAILARSGLDNLMFLAGIATAISIIPVSLLGALGITRSKTDNHTVTNEVEDYA